MSTSKVPSNWRNFLRDNNNKTEIFKFLADKITQMSATNMIIVTKEDDAVSNHPTILVKMAPCSHEEADTRIFVHARQAVEEGCKHILIKANDTVILLIAVSVLPTLQEIGLQKLWVAFGRKAAIWDGFPSMNCFCPLDCRRAKTFSPSMPLLAAMLCQPSMVKARRLHGKPGMFVLRFLMFSANSVSIHQQYMVLTWRHWKTLWPWCMTDPVQLMVLVMQGWTCQAIRSHPSY